MKAYQQPPKITHELIALSLIVVDARMCDMYVWIGKYVADIVSMHNIHAQAWTTPSYNKECCNCWVQIKCCRKFQCFLNDLA